MNPVKLIVTHKKSLQFKYGKSFSDIEQSLREMVKADRKKSLTTRVVYVDDPASASAAHVTPIKNPSDQEFKRVIDDLYAEHVPAYIALLGAQDVVPFQELDNPAVDEDEYVPSDLPYACDAPYSRKVTNFTGPTRVVGRIPDIPGQQANASYLQSVLQFAMQHQPIRVQRYLDSYFAITANEWRTSTRQSLFEMFRDPSLLIDSPKGKRKGKRKGSFTYYSKSQLKPLVHFYNCHGAQTNLFFYGQQKKYFPQAFVSMNVKKNISKGTVVAAECCFGAELFDHNKFELEDISIANNYLLHGALGFVGSTNTAYGPGDSQGLADLITQHFVIRTFKGASTGRAFLEARQSFLSDVEPDLDPYELKTLAQFCLLGDPSVQPAQCEEAEIKTLSVSNATLNNRKRLYSKGKSLEASIGKTYAQKRKDPVRHRKEVKAILHDTHFSEKQRSKVYRIAPKTSAATQIEKTLSGGKVKFYTYIKPEPDKRKNQFTVLVIKEDDVKVLGHRVYYSH